MRALVLALGASVAVACKSAPSELPASDAAPPRHASDGVPQIEPSAAPTTTVSGPLNSRLAETIAKRMAYEKWGHAPKDATAWHMPSGGWRVTVIFQEPNLTANLYFKDDGTYVDGGVFGETDR
jgi:hypothetical protein